MPKFMSPTDEAKANISLLSILKNDTTHNPQFAKLVDRLESAFSEIEIQGNDYGASSLPTQQELLTQATGCLEDIAALNIAFSNGLSEAAFQQAMAMLPGYFKAEQQFVKTVSPSYALWYMQEDTIHTNVRDPLHLIWHHLHEWLHDQNDTRKAANTAHLLLGLQERLCAGGAISEDSKEVAIAKYNELERAVRETGVLDAAAVHIAEGRKYLFVPRSGSKYDEMVPRIATLADHPTELCVA